MGDSPSSSPRHRRDSGSVTSRDGLSPKMSPRHSPRESLNSSPAHMISPRATPPALRHLVSSPFMRGSDNEADILDFSLRRSPAFHKDDQLSMSARSSLAGSPPPGLHRLGDSPLDLSVPRKRAADALLEAQGKMQHDLAKGLSSWGISLPPHLASAMAMRPDLAALKPDLALWNGKLKGDNISTKLPPFPMGPVPPQHCEGTRALERMSELSRLGGEGGLDLFRGGLGGSSGRATAWQSHWLSKGQDATKDVLKCVWCKASFNTLAELTTHMKEAKHCGVNLPPPIPPPSSSSSSIHTHLPPQYTPSKMPSSKPPSSSSSSSLASGSSSSNDLMSSIKETMPLPRKLVRGQDVWLGKGAEQTRQILKCMWCGQSFKSLAEMTQHMQQTQHYTNIISQEQIISWRSPEDKTPNQSHVNAVLTCKVCDQAFASLKELSNHMVKNAHYKEHIMRSITESGARRRQTREKRKKSLPVRKLLELERAQQDMRSPSDSGRGLKEQAGSGRISCEKCGDKIETSLFVDHIRNCVGASSRDLLKSALLSPDSDYSNKLDSAPETDSEGKKTPEKTPRDSPREKEFEKTKGRGASDSPSVLSALEKLIEKSFDTGKGKPGAGPLGSSILRRLGIDESVDYSKPLMDPQLMGMYATFSRLHGGPPHGPGAPSTFNLPPSFGSSDRGGGLRGLSDSMMSPGADSDTRDTFPRSPSRPGSRPASTGSITRDGSGSERSLELLRPDSHRAITPEDITPTENGADHSDNEHASLCGREEVKQEPPEINGEISDRDNVSVREEVRVKEEIRVKEEFKMKEEGDEEEERDLISDVGRESPTARLMGSPAGCSSRSETPHSETSIGGRSGSGLGAGGLGGLSALLGGGGGGSSSHPLAALQKLCDKTETQPRAPPGTGSTTGPQTNPGAILAFSWACNDAVTADSIMKCAFCDTPFISKGAYRHHLSKMHFVKDGVIPEHVGHGKPNNGKGPPPPGSSATPPAPPADESPHSKFLKYTELAKQLSSK
ncbi:Protein tiptop [Chionoecetes opilio]|uniref:Protein tiptop n=1 Tax=Chionoecetes opilio TaxID=41210 RepID=A0A8J4XM84_CHIOP|nr:Protein tiptop [Chionoecetes opilio]